MDQDLFVDSIGEISVSNGVVFIDLMPTSATEKDAENRPLSEFRKRLVMPLNTFLGAYGAMDNVITQLVDRGVVTRRETAKD